MRTLWKVIVALVAILFSLCSACGFVFSLDTSMWSISVPWFLIFGALAYLLWWYFGKLMAEEDDKPKGMGLNG